MELILVCPIITRMRRIFLVLMIVLLPLRGWVGDVMAVEMASQSSNATESVANYASHTRATAKFDGKYTPLAHVECPGHAATALESAADWTGGTALAGVVDAGDATTDGAAKGKCNTCGACQLCHTVALANTVAARLADFTPDTLPSIGSTRFASALTALSQKPPIS